MKKIINNTSINYIITIIFIFLLMPYLDCFRRINVDENWYSNVAFNFSIGNGLINTNAGSGGGDEIFLLPLITGTFFYLFGTSLWIARLVSLLAGALSIFFYLKILDKLDLKLKEKVIGSILFIISYNYILLFRQARPEALVFMFFMISSYNFLQYYLIKGNGYLFFTSLFAGLSFLCHPWGLSIFLLFGLFSVFLVLKNKKYIGIIYFGFGILIIAGILISFIVFIKHRSVVEFFSSWHQRAGFSNSNVSFFDGIVFNIQQMLNKYLTGSRIFIFLFHLMICIYSLFFYKKHKIIFHIAILQITLFLISNIFYSSSGNEYLLHFIYFFTYVNFVLIFYLSSYYNRMVLIVVSAIFIINNFIGVFIVFKKEHYDSYDKIAQNIDDVIPDHTIVISSMHFWFPCKNNDFYPYDLTRWQFKKYKNLSDLLSKQNNIYILTADVEGSGFLTSSEAYRIFKYPFKEILRVNTNNYNTIHIYRIK